MRITVILHQLFYKIKMSSESRYDFKALMGKLSGNHTGSRYSTRTSAHEFIYNVKGINTKRSID